MLRNLESKWKRRELYLGPLSPKLVEPPLPYLW